MYVYIHMYIYNIEKKTVITYILLFHYHFQRISFYCISLTSKLDSSCGHNNK